MSEIKTKYNPGGAGVTYAFQMMAQEDEVFHKNATSTLYQQNWKKFTPHHAAVVLQSFTNNGAGNQLELQLSKSPDYYGTTYHVSYWKGIKPNSKLGVTSSSYVNGRGYHAIESATISVSQQLVHSTSGHTAFLMTDLYGNIDTYGAYAGVFKTRAQLIADSAKDRVKYTLMSGWAFADPSHPERAWAVGGVAFHPVTAKYSTRGMSQLTVNYDDIGSNNGLYALPLHLNDAPVSDKSAHFALATNSIWGGKNERNGLVFGSTETIFREMISNTPRIISASSSAGTQEIDLDFRGPLAYIAVTIRSTADLASGNWTKDCNDQGGHYISDAMIITGSTAVEDGLPADFYSGPKVTDAFGSQPQRHTYVWSFETDANSVNMTGHLTTTNMDKLKFSANYFAHDGDLQVDAIGAVYNGWYTENGTSSRIWS